MFAVLKINLFEIGLFFFSYATSSLTKATTITTLPVRPISVTTRIKPATRVKTENRNRNYTRQAKRNKSNHIIIHNSEQQQKGQTVPKPAC